MDDLGNERSKYRRAKEVFQAALDKSTAELTDFLAEACAGDDELRAEVESLLECDEAAKLFLKDPPRLPEIPPADEAATGPRSAAAPDGVEDDASAPSPDTDLTGLMVGAYRLEKLLGRGGMGAVYLAARADGEFEKRVAVKFIRTSLASAADLRRFRAERQILADFEHRNIARLLDGGTTEDGRPYLIMEYVDGESLAEMLKRGPLSVDEALRVARGIADALRALHARELVFRDLKPSNVMLTATGEVKVLDFGIAKPLLSEVGGSGTPLTAPGWIVGSPNYMAPEQALADPVDERADIFAFGVLLFEILSGRLPFEGDSTPEYIHNVIHTEAAGLPPQLPAELRQLVDTCLSKNPARRFQSGDPLYEALRSLAAEREREDTPWHRTAALFGLPTAAVLLAVFASIVAYRFGQVEHGGGEPLSAPTPVVTWASNEEDPRISPDGNWYSFVSDRGGERKIWLRASDGSIERSIEPGGGTLAQHVWSTQSDRIAFVTRTSSRWFLNIVSLTAPQQPEVRELPIENALLVGWIGPRVYLLGDGALWRYNLDEDAAPRQVTVWDRGFVVQEADVRADERRIVLAAVVDGFAGLWVADLDGGNRKQVTFEREEPASPRWIGETDGIVFCSERDGLIDVRRLDTETGAERALTFTPSVESGAAVSPDGSWLLVLSTSDKANIELVDPGDEEPVGVQLTDDSLSDQHPSASGDAQVLAFQRANKLDAPSFYDVKVIVEDHASSVQQVLEADGFAPLLSADGLWVSYRTRAGDPPTVALWARQIVDDISVLVSERFVRPGSIRFPFGWVSNNLAWSPLGPELYFAERSESGRQQVMRIDLSVPRESAKPEVLVELDDTTDAISDIRLSNDGQRVSFVVKSNSRARWELREYRIADRRTNTIYWEALGYVPRYLGPLTRDDAFVIVRFPSPHTGTMERAEVVRLTRDGNETVYSIRNMSLGSPSIDEQRGVLYFVSVDSDSHRIMSLRLQDGSARVVLDSAVQGRTFSGLRVLSDGRLLFSRHDRNQNLWRIELES